ncbi:MAG: CinA family protein [Suilimivivens sp.]
MSLEEEVVLTLRKKGYDVTTAESCTGGMIAATLVNVAGVSEIYKEGYITYANEAKQRILGVKKETLEAYGAVSEQTAYEMALGVANAAGASCSVAVTGIAGPDGGTREKPVGLVYIGCYVNGKVTVEKNLFQGDRLSVRKKAADQALKLLLDCLKEE